MKNFIVLLDDQEPENVKQKGRRAVYQAGVQRTREFYGKLKTWVDDNHLTNQVQAIGEPTTFPFLAVTCTPVVAEKIKTVAGVQSVVQDADGLSLIP